MKRLHSVTLQIPDKYWKAIKEHYGKIAKKYNMSLKETLGMMLAYYIDVEEFAMDKEASRMLDTYMKRFKLKENEKTMAVNTLIKVGFRVSVAKPLDKLWKGQ